MQIYHLSKVERAILSVCQLDTQLTHQEIGTSCGVRAHTVGRVIRRMVSAGVLRPYPVVNHFALGRFEFGLYLSTTGSGGAGRMWASEKKVPKTIGAITRLGGRNNLCLDLIVSSPAEATSALNQRKLLGSEVVLEQKLVMRVRRTILQRRFFASYRARTTRIDLSPLERSLSVDQVDLKLIEAIASSPSATLLTLGRELGLSPSAVLARRRALRASGVLAGEAYAVVSLRLGLFVFRVLISLRTPTVRERGLLSAFLLSATEVVTITECVGAWDYEVRVEAFTLAEIEAFRARLEQTLGPNLQSIELVPFLGTTYMSAFSP